MDWLRWMRYLAIARLVLCVYCKMIDLDCALYDPVHCQSLLESDDNSFAQLPGAMVTIQIEPFLTEMEHQLCVDGLSHEQINQKRCS